MWWLPSLGIFPLVELRESIRWWHCERIKGKRAHRGAWAEAFRTGSDPGVQEVQYEAHVLRVVHSCFLPQFTRPPLTGIVYIQEYFAKLTMPKQNKKVLAVVDDLLFTVKISDTAKRLGLETEFLKSDTDVLDRAKTDPLMIIIDLNATSVQPLKLIEKLKSDPDLKSISLIAYLSHVQGELKLKAQEAGANVVMARSAFSQNLPQLLKRHAGIV